MIIYLSREYYRKWQEAEKTNKELQARIAELEALVNVSEGLYERIYEQAARIAELEAENIRLGIEYQRMRLALGDIAINSKRALAVKDK